LKKGTGDLVKIRVEDTKKKTLNLNEVEPAVHYPALVELEKAGEAVFTAPVSVEVNAQWEYDHVRVNGSVQSAVRLTCSRCLAEYQSEIASDFTIFYTQAGKASEDEEVELTDEELISVSYQGEEIDLDFEISEQVMMGIPYKPLCSESCKGLCPDCGADLNARDCGCERGEINLKMSALKNIKIDK